MKLRLILLVISVMGVGAAVQAATCRATSSSGDLRMTTSDNSFFEHNGPLYEITVHVQSNEIVRIPIGDKRKKSLSTSYGNFSSHGTFLGQIEELNSSSGPLVRVECNK